MDFLWEILKWLIGIGLVIGAVGILIQAFTYGVGFVGIIAGLLGLGLKNLYGKMFGSH